MKTFDFISILIERDYDCTWTMRPCNLGIDVNVKIKKDAEKDAAVIYNLTWQRPLKIERNRIIYRFPNWKQINAYKRI